MAGALAAILNHKVTLWSNKIEKACDPDTVARHANLELAPDSLNVREEETVLFKCSVILRFSDDPQPNLVLTCI